MNPQPKPVKRRTVKARKRNAKAANIGDVWTTVCVRDGERCRIGALLERFGFANRSFISRLELAHVEARGMGGNPDLSRDTTANTLLVRAALHQGGKYTMHGGHIQIQALTDKGMDGAISVSFFEKLPSECE